MTTTTTWRTGARGAMMMMVPVVLRCDHNRAAVTQCNAAVRYAVGGADIAHGALQCAELTWRMLRPGLRRTAEKIYPL
eukprot:855128-Rhodomonas_salina.1